MKLNKIVDKVVIIGIGAVIGLSIAAVVTGCTDKYSEAQYPVLPAELKDCKFFNIENSGGGHMKIARCPNSMTSITHPQGKSHESTVTIDGIEYVKKEQ